MGAPDTPPVTTLGCGQPFARGAGGVLALAGRFPAAVDRGEPSLAGVVEVTSAEHVAGVLTPTADVFLVRDGRVRTLPVPQDSVGVRLDLAPGAVQLLAGQVSLVPCDPVPDGPALPAATYEIYARVVLHADDGSATESVGGPWALQVR